MPADGEIEPENDPIVIASTVPECLSNPTLGAAANGVFLDVMEEQARENHRAEVENRPARIAKREARYPGYSKNNTGSNHSDVSYGTHYEDGTEVVAPQGGNVTPAFGRMLKARTELITGSQGVVQPTRSRAGQAPQMTPKAPEKPAQAPSRPSPAPRGTIQAPKEDK